MTYFIAPVFSRQKFNWQKVKSLSWYTYEKLILNSQISDETMNENDTIIKIKFTSGDEISVIFE